MVLLTIFSRDEEDSLAICPMLQAIPKSSLGKRLHYVLVSCIFRWITILFPSIYYYVTFKECSMEEASLIRIIFRKERYYVQCHRVGMSESNFGVIQYSNKSIPLHNRVDSSIETLIAEDSKSYGNDSSFCYFEFRNLRYFWKADESQFITCRGLDGFLKPCQMYEMAKGLSHEVRSVKREIYGDNAMCVHVKSFIRNYFETLWDPFYIVQLLSVGIWFWDEYEYYAGTILIIIFSTVGINAYQLKKNTAKLQEMVYVLTNVNVVLNDGTRKTVKSDTLVPGDVILVPGCGSIIPCDCVLLSGQCVVNESMLTGESFPTTKVPIVQKYIDHIYSTLSDKQSTLFCGTTVSQLRGYENNRVLALVTNTGFTTYKGMMVQSVIFPKPLKFAFFRDSLRFLGIMACIALIGVGYSLYLFISINATISLILRKSLDIITITIPPGLPAALAVATIYSVRRLRKKGLSCIDPTRINICGKLKTMCFDKTGTLTEEGVNVCGILTTSRDEETCFNLNTVEHLADLSDPHIEKCMTSCHNLTNIDGSIVGDPIDLVMFNFTGWSLDLSDSPIIEYHTNAHNDMDETAVGGLCMNAQEAIDEMPVVTEFPTNAQDATDEILVVTDFPTNTQEIPVVQFPTNTQGASDEMLVVTDFPTNTQDATDEMPVLTDFPTNTQETPVVQFPTNTQEIPAVQFPTNTQEIPVVQFPTNTQEIPTVQFPTNTYEATDEMPVVTEFPTVVVPPKMNVAMQNQRSKSISILNENEDNSANNGFKSPISILKVYQFESHLQRMTVVSKEAVSGQLSVFMKGSPESVMKFCTNSSLPIDFDSVLFKYAQMGYRIIAMAFKDLPIRDSWHKMIRAGREEIEKDMVFLGFLLFHNKLKPESKKVIQELASLKTRLCMITGDNLITSLAIGCQCGILNTEFPIIQLEIKVKDGVIRDNIDEGLNSEELNNYFDIKLRVHDGEKFCQDTPKYLSLHRNKGSSNHFLKQIVMDGDGFEIARDFFPKERYEELLVSGVVFARMSPQQKADLVKDLQSIGYVVGMTGDGANDCGALKIAHAGIALAASEASVVAPFSSRKGSLKCVISLMSEGRTSLVTAFAMFKFVLAYSLTQFTSVVILYHTRSNLGDFQFLFIDLPVLAFLVLTMANMKPSMKLSSKRPLGRLVHPSIFFSMFGSYAIQCILHVTIIKLVALQAWYIEAKPESNDNLIYTSQQNACIFTCVNFIYLFQSIAVSIGPPYRLPCYLHKKYMMVVLYLFTFCFILLFCPEPILKNFFDLDDIPTFRFRFILFAITMVFSSLLILLEYMLTNNSACIRFVKIFRFKKGNRNAYKNIIANIRHDEKWPMSVFEA